MIITDMTDTSATEVNDRNIVTTAAATPFQWPYSACSGILDRKLAANIRAWALTRMSEAELHSYSQGQLLSMYLEQHIRPTLERVAPWMRMGSEGPEERSPVTDDWSASASAGPLKSDYRSLTIHHQTRSGSRGPLRASNTPCSP
jgi:hypothetical protein